MDRPDNICVGKIGAAHGVRGEVKLWSFTADPLAIADLWSAGDGGRQAPVRDRGQCGRQGEVDLVARLKGVADRNEGERRNGIELYVAREKLPEIDDDEFYVADLVGLKAACPRRNRSAKSSPSIISAPAI